MHFSNWEFNDIESLKEARALWVHDSPQKALRKFKSITQKHPRNVIALIDSARAHGEAHQIPYAKKLLNKLQQAVSQLPNSEEIIGQTLRMIHCSEEAETYLKQATKKNSVEALVELVNYYERTNQLELALEYIESSKSRNGEILPALQLVKTRIFRRQGQSSEVEKICLKIINSDDIHKYFKSAAYYELVYLYDSQGEYQKAFDSAIKAKEDSSHLLENYRTDIEWWDRKSIEFVDGISQEKINDWREQSRPGKNKKCLFTGAPRSGTTLIQQILNNHPDIETFDELDIFPRFIFGSLLKGIPKETHGAEIFEKISKNTLRTQSERYDELFGYHRKLVKPTLIFDKNPSATGKAPIYLRLFPHDKVLFAKRDPRDIAISCFLRFFPPNSTSAQFYQVASTCDYVARDHQLRKRMLAKLDQDSAHSVSYEQLVADFDKTTSELLNFLQLSQQGNQLVHDPNNLTQINSPSYQQVRKPINSSSIGRWKNYEFAFGEAFDRFFSNLT